MLPPPPKRGGMVGSFDEKRLNIGYVMRGQFSQLRGSGIGMGVLIQPREFEGSVLDVLRKQREEFGKIVVLFRNRASLVYQPATVSVLE
mmetsp:Transcript_5445/g.9197  ORF Transcript_5445/g.9197 Transcript_5445/m.9197 type:complete len:89 (+) Transcript_5445:2453-2719(+)